jgi:transcriptional regulator with XRE-family HTH domain
MPFVIRKFDNAQTLGQKLKAMRRAANFTMNEMEKKTKIRKVFLKAFESGAYNKLPAPIYARNYLKTYVKALGGNETYFLDQFEEERGTCDFVGSARLPRRRTRALQFLVASKFIKVGALMLVGLTVLTYVGVQLRTIASPPELLVYAPNDGELTGEALIAVTGHAEEGASVNVNGEEVLLSQDGFFETDIALERGVNLIIIESTKRYSRPAVEQRRVVLDQNRSISLAE